jgi:OmpA-OmpF porin, OOP family
MKRSYLISTMAILVSITVCILFLPLSSHAEIKAGSTNVSIFAGGFTADNEMDLAEPYTDGELKTRFTAGLGLGYNFTPNWGVEGVVNNVWGKFSPKGALSDRHVQTDLFHLDLLYHITPEKKLVPYVAVGLGWITYNPAANQLDTTTNLLGNIGGGVKYFITPCVALRGDVRYVLEATREQAENRSDTSSNLLYNIGLTFAFGGGEKAAEAAAPAPVAQPAPKEEVVPTPPPAPAPEEPAIIEKGRITLDIQFDTGKAVVKDTYHDELAKFADVMKKHPDLKVTIEGHTDNVGKAAMNLKLSQARAESVKNYLVSKFGIDASRLTAKGYGQTRPIADNATKEGKQKNRRVEAAVDY